MIERAASTPGWLVGYLDESWFSRLAQPALSAWTTTAEEKPLGLYEKTLPQRDKSARAVACYGVFVPEREKHEQMLIRFVEGQPVSNVTCAFLDWLAKTLEQSPNLQKPVRVLVLFWDNASWHVSREVKDWLRCHNRVARERGGVRFLPCRLPTKSPWLNRIEPKWVHAKRAICEPVRILSATEIMQRLCDYYHCENQEMIETKTMPK